MRGRRSATDAFATGCPWRGTGSDEVGDDDSTGRALWALGTAAARATRADQREQARTLLLAGAGFRSDWPRANAFAILGAVDLLEASSPRPEPDVAALLAAAACGLGSRSPDAAWPWPEPRLAYANAVLAEARVAAGSTLGHPALLEEGLDLLAWLVAVETVGDHFSFTPVGGRGPGERGPALDQQPIEAAAMADACARAFAITGESRWAASTLLVAEWFLGANDLGLALFDRATGGGKDGLHGDRVNENMGAESTLAAITALQQTRRIQQAARRAATTSAVTTVAPGLTRGGRRG